jgi:hypothetical protein
VIHKQFAAEADIDVPSDGICRPVLEATIDAPPRRLTELAAILMSPPRPCPEVATEITPPSVTVNAGVDTLIVPAGPAAEAVLNSPLLLSGLTPKTGSLDLPEMLTEPVALSDNVPPAPWPPRCW